MLLSAIMQRPERHFHHEVKGSLPEIPKLRWQLVDREFTLDDMRKLHVMSHRQFVGLYREAENGKPGQFDTAGGGDRYEGALFGRDSAIMTLQAIRTAKIYKKIGRVAQAEQLLHMAKNSVESLFATQSAIPDTRIGREPGKVIHEKRLDGSPGHKELVEKGVPGVLPPFAVNEMTRDIELYDSVDSTALTVRAAYEYWEASGNNEFLRKYLPNITAGLDWMVQNGGDDFLAKFSYPRGVANARLPVQGMCDSFEFLAQSFRGSQEELTEWQQKGETDSFTYIKKVDNEWHLLPPDPIAPAEAQGWTWLALNQWGDFFSHEGYANLHSNEQLEFGGKLKNHAAHLKIVFNKKYIYEDSKGRLSIAQALSNGERVEVRTGIALSNLWATYQNPETEKTECIVANEQLPRIVKDAFSDDLYDPLIGFTTMSKESPTYNIRYYHNGKTWVMINSLIQMGLEDLGYKDEAQQVALSYLRPVLTTGTSHELGHRIGIYYLNHQHPLSGKVGCMEQGFSAGGIMATTAVYL